MKNNVELLCPVGGMDSLEAALLGGADAVYFGGQDFNARMHAKNFDRQEILTAIGRCHDKGVRVYVTLNTLLTDRLLPQALDFAGFLYRSGCDALIVADPGFASLIRNDLPDFPLHASTQMSGHNVGAAQILSEKGFSRMVCARELDRENLAVLCRKSPIEIELFVHGALCASHSGQCLMSSMIGARSGNRGECAQPCRLPYNGAYPLSLKDLSLASHAKEVLSLGVSSLKIEGRMKSPAYVYTVARIWHRLIREQRNATPKELNELAGIFSRSGFTDSYFTRSLSPAMLGTRRAEDKKMSRDTKVRFSDVGRRAPAILVEREKKEIAMPPLPPKENGTARRSARFYDPGQIPETDFFREVYLPLASFHPKKANGVFLPPVVFDKEASFVRLQLEQAAKQGAQHVLVSNLGQLPLLEGLPFQVHGDFRLNIMNSFSFPFLPDLEDAIASPELNMAQLRDLRGKKRVIVYGRLPLMLLERPLGVRSLRDRRGMVFPVLREGKRDILLNSVPLYMGDKQKELLEKGLLDQHFLFTVETRLQVETVIRAFQEGASLSGPIKRIS